MGKGEACKDVMEHGQLLVNQQQPQRERNTNKRKKPGGRTQTSAKGITSNVRQGDRDCF